SWKKRVSTQRSWSGCASCCKEAKRTRDNGREPGSNCELFVDAVGRFPGGRARGGSLCRRDVAVFPAAECGNAFRHRVLGSAGDCAAAFGARIVAAQPAFFGCSGGGSPRIMGALPVLGLGGDCHIAARARE